MMDSSSTSRRLRRLGWALFAAAFWLSLWWWLSALVGQKILLPSPQLAFTKLISLMGTANFYRSILNTFGRILIGFAGAALLGALLAALAFMLAPVRALLAPVMQAAKATPVASIIILILIFVSTPYVAAFTSFLMVLPVMYINTLNGLQSADKKLLEMAKVFRLSTWQRARAIYIPAAYPYFLSACDVSLGMSWKAGIAAEVIGLPKQSVGEALYLAKLNFAAPEIFAWTLAIILISVAIEKTAMLLLKRARAGFGGKYGD